ncbi:hypothetical protein [Polaromonas sp.]|uniref:hypothetical protein n=1 Tax=Polaromonas sp. TaxID=1869339 RepID=UPI002FC7C5D5
MVKNLEDIRRLQPSVFEDLKEKFYQCGTNYNHFGLRMEARIASSLSRKNVTFEYADAPDFFIVHEDQQIFIECTSVWPDTSSRDKDYRKNVALAIQKKAEKKYSNENTAVAMDVTSILAAMITHGTRDEATDFYQYLGPVLDQSKLGAVILFNTVYSAEVNMLHFVYNRFDCPKISPALRNFMDATYPVVGGKLCEPVIPGARTPGLNQSSYPTTGT